MKIVLLALALFLALSLFVLIVHRMMTERRFQRARQALEQNGSGERFTGAMLADLPPVAQRYLAHAMAEGTPLAACVEAKMTGEFAVSPARWLPMRCRYLVGPDGFAWNAMVGSGLVFLRALDFYTPDEGRVDVRLWGLVPIVQSHGKDVTRSARGRAAIERIFNPALLLPARGVRWEDLDSTRTRASFNLQGEPQALELTVDEAGRLRELQLARWGNVRGGAFEWLTFGGRFDAEATFSGYTIPSRLAVGWHYGEPDYNEFFRAEVVEATFR